jgi:S1-C subfamily serine protease
MTAAGEMRRCAHRWVQTVSLAAGLLAAGGTHADVAGTIERVKGSVVAVGTWQQRRVPAFEFRGTGFAVDDGSRIVTNAHVLPAKLDDAQSEKLAILIAPRGKGQAQVREVDRSSVDVDTDLALLQLKGVPLPALALRDSDGVREGQGVLFTGFPIGNVLGPFPSTHRGMIAAITPIAIPPARAGELNQRLLRRLTTGSYPIFQLDATAYPGSSGSPVYDPETGEVLGIVNMVFVKGTKEAALTQPSGITYAIPSKYLQELLQKGR